MGLFDRLFTTEINLSLLASLSIPYLELAYARDCSTRITLPQRRNVNSHTAIDLTSATISNATETTKATLVDEHNTCTCPRPQMMETSNEQWNSMTVLQADDHQPFSHRMAGYITAFKSLTASWLCTKLHEPRPVTRHWNDAKRRLLSVFSAASCWVDAASTIRSTPYRNLSAALVKRVVHLPRGMPQPVYTPIKTCMQILQLTWSTDLGFRRPETLPNKTTTLSRHGSHHYTQPSNHATPVTTWLPLPIPTSQLPLNATDPPAPRRPPLPHAHAPRANTVPTAPTSPPSADHGLHAP